MDDVMREFLIESYENLDRLDRDPVVLEKDPGDKENLASIFRTIHTLKGGSGFLALGKLEAVAHVGENLLSKLRDGLMSITPDLVIPLMLGYTLHCAVPANRRFDPVRAIMIIIAGTPTGVNQVLAAGVDEFFTKSFHHKNVGEKLASW